MTGQLLGLDIARVKDARTGRCSSYDQRGRNQDGWVIAAGESVVLADVQGPGAITHFFITTFCRRVIGPGYLDPIETAETAPVIEMHNALGMNWEVTDPDYYRKVLIRITWDDASQPAVLVPSATSSASATRSRRTTSRPSSRCRSSRRRSTISAGRPR